MSIKKLLSAFGLSVILSTMSHASTVTHAQGEMEIVSAPETVLVYDLAVLDTLDVLGVKVDGIPAMGLPPYLGHYDDADIARIGSLFEPDFEAVAALEPDLVIVGGRSAPKYAEIAAIAPTIDLTVDRTDFVASAKKNAETLGRIFGKEAEAAEAVAQLDASIAKLREKSADAGKVLVILTTGGRMSAHGPGSRFGVVYDEYGFSPAVEQLDTGNHGQSISNEFILETNPDWLFVVDRDAAIGREGQAARELLDNELVRQTTAWQKDQVVYLDAMSWYVVGGGLTAMKISIDQLTEAVSKD